MTNEELERWIRDLDNLVDQGGKDRRILSERLARLEESFKIVRAVVYGMVGLALSTVLGAILVTVIQQGKTR